MCIQREKRIRHCLLLFAFSVLFFNSNAIDWVFSSEFGSCNALRYFLWSCKRAVLLKRSFFSSLFLSSTVFLALADLIENHYSLTKLKFNGVFFSPFFRRKNTKKKLEKKSGIKMMNFHWKGEFSSIYSKMPFGDVP